MTTAGATAHSAMARSSSSGGASPWAAATRVVSASMMAAKSATRLRRTRSARRSSSASGETWTNSSVAMSRSSACRSGSGPSTGRRVSMVTPSTSRISSRRRSEQVVAGQADPELVDDDAVVALEDVDRDHVAADRADAAGHRTRGHRVGRAAGRGSGSSAPAQGRGGMCRHGFEPVTNSAAVRAAGRSDGLGAVPGGPLGGGRFLRLAYSSTYSWPDRAAISCIRASVRARSSSWSGSSRPPPPGAAAPVVTAVARRSRRRPAGRSGR